MTNQEALEANISDVHGVVLSENHFRKALIDVGLSPDDEYASSTLIDTATLKLYDKIIAGASFSEGALSYNVDINALKSVRDALAEDLGLGETVVTPTINNAPRW